MALTGTGTADGVSDPSAPSGAVLVTVEHAGGEEPDVVAQEDTVVGDLGPAQTEESLGTHGDSEIGGEDEGLAQVVPLFGERTKPSEGPRIEVVWHAGETPDPGLRRRVLEHLFLARTPQEDAA